MAEGSVLLAYCHPDEVTHCFFRSWTETLAFDLLTGQNRLDPSQPYKGMFVSTNQLVRARNDVVAHFLDHSTAEWLWWADTDMGWQHDAMHQLLELADPVERPIVGGLCFSFKNAPHADAQNGVFKVAIPTIYTWTTEPVAGVTPFLDYPANTVVRCDATGSAFILIHRTVLERMRAEFSTWYDQIALDDSGVLGEDLSFCWRAGQLGYPIYVDTSVRITHYKTAYVDESMFLSQMAAKPATDEVAVIVPVVGRPQNAEPFMRYLRASTGLARCYAICETDDQESIDAWKAAGAVVEVQDGTTFAQKVNHGYRVTTEPWLFLVGDDVRFHATWFDHALAVAKGHGAKVIGTNDLGTQRVQSGDHATHFLVARDYIDEVGASWDGPGVVCHEYHHWYVDDEIVTAAKQRGVWSMALGSIVEHMHPLFGRAEDDDTYRKGQARADEDRETFMSRLVRNVGFPGLVRDGFGAAQRDVHNGVYPSPLLGFDPFPGTLNLTVQRGVLERLGDPDERIPGPECELWLWRATINELDVWLMHPDRPPSVRNAEKVEVLAPVSLRDLWGLANGSRVQVKPR